MKLSRNMAGKSAHRQDIQFPSCRLFHRLFGRCVTLRVHSHEPFLPEEALEIISGAVEKMHSKRDYYSPFCFDVADEIIDEMKSCSGAASSRLLYCWDLSEHRGAMPRGWSRPIWFGNHALAYVKLGNHHFAVDGTAYSYG
jgi:hypothetical protein